MIEDERSLQLEWSHLKAAGDQLQTDLRQIAAADDVAALAAVMGRCDAHTELVLEFNAKLRTFYLRHGRLISVDDLVT